MIVGVKPLRPPSRAHLLVIVMHFQVVSEFRYLILQASRVLSTGSWDNMLWPHGQLYKGTSLAFCFPNINREPTNQYWSAL